MHPGPSCLSYSPANNLGARVTMASPAIILCELIRHLCLTRRADALFHRLALMGIWSERSFFNSIMCVRLSSNLTSELIYQIRNLGFSAHTTVPVLNSPPCATLLLTSLGAMPCNTPIPRQRHFLFASIEITIPSSPGLATCSSWPRPPTMHSLFITHTVSSWLLSRRSQSHTRFSPISSLPYSRPVS
jgi:hypothetical protein